MVTPVDATDTYGLSERNSPDGVTVHVARPTRDVVVVADTR